MVAHLCQPIIMLHQLALDSTILLTRAGSHAYGTATPTSDLDLRGVMIPPREYYLGLSRVEQYQQAAGVAADGTTTPDLVIYELKKYLTLAADANPNILEILFCDDTDILRASWAGWRLRESRNMFLSRKAKHTYSGYAIAQLKKIESHRRWLLSPPSAPPQRKDFGLPERTVIDKDQLSAATAMMRRKVADWENTLPSFGVDCTDEASTIEMREKIVGTLAEIKAATQDERILAAGRVLGFDANFLDLLDRERRYEQKRREWDSFKAWQATRNETRSELERKYGYDTKHGSHLVRLMRTCREILVEGELRVRRPDAAELLAIRNGAWSYERLIGWAREQDAELNEVMLKSKLPHGPDRKAIGTLCEELLEWELGSDCEGA